MPTVLKIGSVIFFFTSYDCNEPLHIHIADGSKECKYWLKGNDGIILADNNGFSRNELLKLGRIVIENYQLINKSWDEHCKNSTKKEYKKDHGKQ
ncbi:MAG: DUF4160 domain-containing protein [Bacteroidia bacterium]|nr:DUF4160 domain-containing protein [Bacteroidia bacterium]